MKSGITTPGLPHTHFQRRNETRWLVTPVCLSSCGRGPAARGSQVLLSRCETFAIYDLRAVVLDKVTCLTL